jgi:hypothetical protein
MNKKTNILKKETNIKSDDEMLTLVEKKKNFLKILYKKL